jgi:hypothetical protein
MLRVVTFATPEFSNAASLLRHGAMHDLGAASFREYGPADVDAWLLSAGLSPGDRGHGWYAWKAHVIRRALADAADGDRVLWLDSTCLPETLAPGGLAPRAAVHLFALAGGPYPLSAWTSPRCLAGLGGDGLDLSQQQLNAACQLYVAGPAAREFAAAYEAACSDYDLVADEPGFAQHRHDQSVLSLLAYAAVAGGSPDVFIDSDVTQFAGDRACAAGLRVLHHRRQYADLPRIAVITATRGGRHLPETLAAVQRQSLPGLSHWVVSDGPDADARVDAACAGFLDGAVPIVRLRLPKRTGADGWNGHRAYAAAPWLAADASHVAWLDDDNVPAPDHYERLVRALAATPGARWAHCLRRLIDADGAPAGVDACESLGGISHSCTGADDYLIDTSCYLIERDLACELSAVWGSPFRGPWEPDRELCKALLSGSQPHAVVCSQPHAVVRAATLAYRLGSTHESVSAEFFARGNASMDWSPDRRDAYLFHFSPEATAAYLAKRHLPTDDVALDEWQPSLWRGLSDEYNLLNGFTNCPNLPQGALCLIALCHPGSLPLDFFAGRPDLRRVAYTLESPNIRHAAQWRAEFLRRHFDVCLTYWDPLLADASVRTVYAPHNTHHLDARSALPRALVATAPSPKALPSPSRGVCVIAELRDLRGSYEIDGVRLTCLDPLRAEYAAGLAARGCLVTAHGLGWAEAGLPGVAVAAGLHRSRDPRTAVDIATGFDWNLIVENCDAAGYCSEKLYDSLIAGAVPLYHGSAPDWVPRGAYVCLRTTGLDEVARIVKCPERLAAYRAEIARSRDLVLARVGTAAFADSVRDAIAITESMGDTSANNK